MAPSLAFEDWALLALAVARPPGARSLFSLARRASQQRGKQAAIPLLRDATRRQPELIEGWIELGFVEDEVAASREQGQGSARQRGVADAAFEMALRADSQSAWARGCQAWALQRGGRPIAAILQALRASGQDPDYSDAWTILAYALADLGWQGLAERALLHAQSLDPSRNWPVLARADLALARRDFEAARIALRGWIRAHAFDQLARAKLSEVAAAQAKAKAKAKAETDLSPSEKTRTLDAAP
jgi:hypothetical protein